MYAALDRFTDSTCIKPSALLFIDKVQIHISVSHISRFDASAVIRRHARFDGLGHLRKLEIRGQIECLENPAYVVAILAQIESEKSIEEQLKELMEAYYNDLEIDYEALFKALTKNS